MRRSELPKKCDVSRSNVPAPFIVGRRISRNEAIGTDPSASASIGRDVIKDVGQEEVLDSGLTAIWAAGMQAIDFLAIGLVICDPTGTVQFLNHTAGRIIRERDVFRLSDSRELTTVATDAPSLNSLFQRLSQSADTNKGGAQAVFTAIPRVSGQRGLTLIIRRAQTLASDDSSQLVIVMLQGTHPIVSRESDLQLLFGFTPAETRLANLLMSGKTTAESCAELRISLSTGCSHLRNMFKKTQVHRQGELVALLLRSIGFLRSRPVLQSIVGGGFAAIDALSSQNEANLAALIQRDVDSNL